MSTLLQSHHIPLIDLDILARQAVAPGSYALSALAAHFGPTILLPDGALNREALGGIVFGNEKERKVLNGIVHPAVRRLLAWEVCKAWLRGERICVVDAPLLIEAGLWKMCGAIVVVYWYVLFRREGVELTRTVGSSETLQLQRLRSRNSLTLAEAQARIGAQNPLSSKLVYADYVIDNSGPLQDLTSQVSRVVTKLHERVGWSWIVSWLLPPWGLMRGALLVGWRLWIKRVGKDKERRKTRGERKGEEIEMRDRRARDGKL